MKKLVQELGRKSMEDLREEVAKLRIEIAKMKLEQLVNPAKDSNILFKKKKKISQLLTILSEKR